MPKNSKCSTDVATEDTTEVSAGDQEVQIDRRWKNRRAEDSQELDNELADAGEDETLANETAEFQPPRRKKQRRRQIDPTTCERDYNDEEIRFMRAMDDYKRDSGRMFPTCSEILEVIRGMGYIKLTEEEQQILDSIQEVSDEMEEATHPELESAEPNEESLL